MKTIWFHSSRNSGGKSPGPLRLGSKKNERAVGNLLRHTGMRRIAGFVKRRLQQSLILGVNLTFALDSMKTFAPDLCSFIENTLQSIKTVNPAIEYMYEDHPFAALTFNIGPTVQTKPHRDNKNLSWGWCAVTSLGDFDPTKGGHLVLWELGLAVEFPPFSTIFLPSAILTHSNTTIGPGEQRSSIVQYNASGLFCWVAHGHRLKSGAKSGELWWDEPRHMFSPVSWKLGEGLATGSTTLANSRPHQVDSFLS